VLAFLNGFFFLLKWNPFYLALDYASIENDLAHLRFPGMKEVRLGFQ